MFAELGTTFRGVSIQTADQIARAPLNPSGGTSLFRCVEEAIKSRPEIGKIGVVMQVLDRLIPGLGITLSAIVNSSESLPFKSDQPTIVAHGREQQVYKINVNGEPLALKLNMDLRGADLNSLIQQATKIKNEHKRMQGWYGHIPGFIPDERILILHGPPFSFPTVAAIQPFIDGDFHCFFEDFTQEQLVDLMREDQELGKNFMLFAERFQEIAQEEQEYPDLLANGNLAIVSNDDKHQLVFIDPHVIYNREAIRQLSPKDRERLDIRTQRIRSVYERISYQ